MLAHEGCGMRMFGRHVAVAALAVASIATLGGCDVDSFMDPSVVGRWENTPTVLPIMSRLEVIDEPEDLLPSVSGPDPADLVPEVREYVFGPGDTATITVFELLTPGADAILTRRIDELGYVRLPVIGEVKVSGLTAKQLEQHIIDILDPDIIKNPTVTAVVVDGRQRTFKVLGPGQGTYAIVKNNFRLLDAVAMAQIPEVDKIYVIRQIALDEIVERGPDPDPGRPGTIRPPLAPTGTEGTGKPDTPDPVDPATLIDDLTGGLEGDDDKPAPEEKPETPGTPESNEPKAEAPSPALSEALDGGNLGEGRYVNVNGKWVLVQGAAPATDGGEDTVEGSGLPPADQLVTQRVIEIDGRALYRGDAVWNIAIRPDDIVRVPDAGGGNIFLSGPGISRPGTYDLPGRNTLTLKQVVAASGGLSGVAIPERVDLIRRIGDDQEATVRLNLRAIYEGVQPDIFLKPNDQVNFGTNAIAGFAAVIRNGFRFSYGFGFLLDRNFGSDIFGVAPSDANGR